MSNRYLESWQAPRRPVYAAEGMAATSHPLASGAAIETLRRGGNALDAALAACAVQCVVEPHMTTLGGDCFVLYAPGGGPRVVAYNGSGWAPAGLDAARLAAEGLARIPPDSPHAVTIPGCVEAWARLNGDHGRLPLAALLEPAIRYAEAGFPVDPRLAAQLARHRARLARDPESLRLFLPGERLPEPGERLRQPALAATLRAVAREGRDGFYRGAAAEDMVAHLRALGGVHRIEDFAAYEGAYVEPISLRYRGCEVYECPPNAQGLAALEMLGILAGFAPGGDPLAPERLHRAVEAQRLAYCDRDAFLADPARAPVPAAALLSEAHLAGLRALIRSDRALDALPPPALPEHKDTVYIAVVDRERNAASLINSIYDAFGSGITAPGSGILLQNRGAGFNADPAHPNGVAPGKRPLNTIIPGLVLREGRAVLAFGVTGGDYQPAGHAHVLGSWLDHGLDIQASVDLPRVFHRNGALEHEAGLSPAALAALAGRGHRLLPAPQPLGGAQAVEIDWRRGALIGASDSRVDGCALGY
jgi:gamma-glutamyltranspeptidase/glutathione hydrolase